MTGISLPWPPSINRLYRAVGGRSILSEAYRTWKRQAGLQMLAQGPRQRHEGPVSLTVELCAPDKRRRDLDNVGFKAVVDLLVEHKIIEADDSRIVREIRARWVNDGPPCTVFITHEEQHG